MLTWLMAGLMQVLLQKSRSWLTLGMHSIARMILLGVRLLTTKQYFSRVRHTCGSPETFLFHLNDQATSGSGW